MNRAGLLALLLLAPFATAEDTFEENFRYFFKEEIEGRWQAEEVPVLRMVMVRNFAKHDVPDAARWLMREVLVREKAANVQREAVRVLSGFKSPRTVEAMAEFWERKLKKPWSARALGILPFGAIKNPASEKPLAVALKDREPRVVAAACRAIGQGKKFKFRPELEKLLRHKHRAVRGAALTALGEFGGEASLPYIWKSFTTDASHRVRLDAYFALKKLTLREDLPGDPRAWEDWWKEMVSEVPEGEPNPWGATFPRLSDKIAPASSFFKIPVLADRLVFVIDVSTDMNNPWKIDHKKERKKDPADRIPSFFSVKTRFDLVKAYVSDCLKRLPETTEVAFVFFNHEVTTFPDNGKYMKNKAKNRSRIRAHLDENVKLGGSTAMYEGFKAGWGFLKEGHEDFNFNRGCDTLIFVTDGQLRSGELKNKPERLIDEVWRVATLRNLIVHTIGLHNHDFTLCKEIAKACGGLYVHAQQAGDPAEPQDLDFWPAKKKAFEESRKKGPRKR